MGWGSALVGHGRPEITEAVIRQAPLGAKFAYVNENALALAEEIISVSPACARIRFCASGTEATMYCQRLARAYTGPTVIITFAGAYPYAQANGMTIPFPTKTHPLLPPPPPH